jgi:hypothetical protein
MTLRTHAAEREDINEAANERKKQVPMKLLLKQATSISLHRCQIFDCNRSLRPASRQSTRVNSMLSNTNCFIKPLPKAQCTEAPGFMLGHGLAASR